MTQEEFKAWRGCIHLDSKRLASSLQSIANAIGFYTIVTIIMAISRGCGC